jgi:peptidoglycan/LPS O-acetylase OafA/YrhL
MSALGLNADWYLPSNYIISSKWRCRFMKNYFAEMSLWIFGTPHQKPVTILKTMVPIRGFAIFLVVLAHAVIMMLAAEDIMAPGTSLSRDFFDIWQIASPVKSIVLELSACAVPIFLFLSGFYTMSTPQTWKAIWSGSRKLLLPMITWSLMAWGISWRKGTGWSILHFLSLFISGRTETGYFFIVLILQFYILSKWLVPVMKKNPMLILVVSMLLQLGTHIYDYIYLFSKLGIISHIGWIETTGPFPEFLFPRFMVSFTLGIWASQSSERFRNIIAEHFHAVLAIAALAAAALVLERGILFRYSYAILHTSEFEATSQAWVGWKASTAFWTLAAIFLIFGWFQKRIPVKILLDKLGKYSFQIFLLHGMALDLTRSVLYKLFSGMRFYGFAGCAVLLVAGIAGPILLTKAIQRWMPGPIRLFTLGN